MVRIPINLTARDANGNESRVASLYVETNTFSGFLAAANQLYDAIRPVSDAIFPLAKFEYAIDYPSNPAPSIVSNSYERAILVFRNGESRGILSVPSPSPVLFNLVGDYGNIVITRERLQLLGLLAPLESALVNFAIPDGSPFPNTFIIGSRQGLV